MVGSGVGRVSSLDAVRGIAIVAVVGTHAFNASIRSVGNFAIPPEIASVFAAGEYGVQLFFALSGWLMFALYSEPGTFQAKAYWARRLARIWPLWAIFVVAYFALGMVPDTGLPLPLALILALIFLSWLSPVLAFIPLGGMSIELEMLHYAMFARWRRASIAVLSGTVIALVCLWFVARGVEAATADGSGLGQAAAAYVRFGPQRSWPFFLLGGAAYMMWKAKQGAEPDQRLSLSLNSSLWAGAALLVLVLTSDGKNDPFWIPVGFVVVMALIAILIDRARHAGAVLRRIGRHSYFTYFAHVFVLIALERMYAAMSLPSSENVGVAWATFVLVVFTCIALAVSTTLGVVSWAAIESPILTWARRRYPSQERRLVPRHE